MKKKIKNIFFKTVLTIAIIGFAHFDAFGQKGELPLASGEWPPYTSEKLPKYGFCTEIISAIVHEMGYQPKYTFYPWKRAEASLFHGEVFGIFPYAINQERKQKYNFSELILINKTMFFFNKNRFKHKPTWLKMDDLKTFSIGGVQGFSYLPAFDKAGLKINLVRLDELNVKKIYRQRVDLIVMDLVVGWTLIQQLYPNEMKMFDTLDKPINTGNSHLMISRKYPNTKRLQNEFNKALKRIKEKGIYQQIFKKYNINFKENKLPTY